MRIAVNTRHLLVDRLEGVGIVTDEVLRRIAEKHPDDQLDYYFDRKFDERFIHSSNVKGFALAPVTRLPILIRFWLDYPVRRHVQKRKPDVFFSPDGFIPLGMGVPKVSMIHDVAYLRYPEHLPARINAFYKKWIPRYLAYTDHIITVSHFSKSEIMDGYNVPEDKITVVYNGISDRFQPVDDAVKQTTRRKYADGKPYLLYLGAIHPRKNVQMLIEAFNLFRSNKASDLQLVLAGRASWQSEDIQKAINESPFRNDIRMAGYISTEDTVPLIGSAEAMIYPSLYEGFGLPLVEAMACGVPVLCSNVTSLPEVAGEAALLFDPRQPEELATQIDKISTDTPLRQQLIGLGHSRAGDFSWDKAADEVYAVLKKFSR